MRSTSGRIVDGFHRLRACRELGIEPRFETRRFDSPLEEKKFAIEVNLHRRHLTPFQRAELAKPLLEIERELAKQRKERSLPKKGQKGFQPVLASSDADTGKATEKVARTVGLSARTLEKALTVLEKAPEEVKKKVRRGQVSINYAYQYVKRQEQAEKAAETPAMPDGTYDVILADPPWRYYLALRGAPDMHYPTMTTDEIAQLDVPAASDAVLFLWATAPNLPDALRVMEAWGFEYKTNIVWVKRGPVGTGYYARGRHELLLIGTKGKPGVPPESARPDSVLEAPRGRHSEKPAEVYGIIEAMYPGRRYLELFARTQRPGWAAWGNEVG